MEPQGRERHRREAQRAKLLGESKSKRRYSAEQGGTGCPQRVGTGPSHALGQGDPPHLDTVESCEKLQTWRLRLQIPEL
jgi:hypothetical protein